MALYERPAGHPVELRGGEMVNVTWGKRPLSRRFSSMPAVDAAVGGGPFVEESRGEPPRAWPAGQGAVHGGVPAPLRHRFTGQKESVSATGCTSAARASIEPTPAIAVTPRPQTDRPPSRESPTPRRSREWSLGHGSRPNTAARKSSAARRMASPPGRPSASACGPSPQTGEQRDPRRRRASTIPGTLGWPAHEAGSGLGRRAHQRSSKPSTTRCAAPMWSVANASAQPGGGAVDRHGPGLAGRALERGKRQRDQGPGRATASATAPRLGAGRSLTSP